MTTYLRCGVCRAVAFDATRLYCRNCSTECTCETYGECQVCRG